MTNIMVKVYLVMQDEPGGYEEVIAAYRSRAEAEKVADHYNELPNQYYYQYVKELDILD